MIALFRNRAVEFCKVTNLSSDFFLEVGLLFQWHPQLDVVINTTRGQYCMKYYSNGYLQNLHKQWKNIETFSGMNAWYI